MPMTTLSLRINSRLKAALEGWAEHQRQSVNGLVVDLLTEAVRKAKKPLALDLDEARDNVGVATRLMAELASKGPGARIEFDHFSSDQTSWSMEELAGMVGDNSLSMRGLTRYMEAMDGFLGSEDLFLDNGLINDGGRERIEAACRKEGVTPESLAGKFRFKRVAEWQAVLNGERAASDRLARYVADWVATVEGEKGKAATARTKKTGKKAKGLEGSW